MRLRHSGTIAKPGRQHTTLLRAAWDLRFSLAPGSFGPSANQPRFLGRRLLTVSFGSWTTVDLIPLVQRRDLLAFRTATRMSDDDVDEELLELLRQSLGLKRSSNTGPPETGVLRDAEYIYDNAIDVAIDSSNTRAAAAKIWQLMQEKQYSFKSWSHHELHPKEKNQETVDFIFTMDLLNFSFWSDEPSGEAFTVEYQDKKWTGYWGLVAALQRALGEGIPITSSDFWQNQEECTPDVMNHVFRSATSVPMPLLEQRTAILREAGYILYEVCLSTTSTSSSRVIWCRNFHAPFYD